MKLPRTWGEHLRHIGPVRLLGVLGAVALGVKVASEKTQFMFAVHRDGIRTGMFHPRDEEAFERATGKRG